MGFSLPYTQTVLWKLSGGIFKTGFVEILLYLVKPFVLSQVLEFSAHIKRSFSISNFLSSMFPSIIIIPRNPRRGNSVSLWKHVAY